MVSIVCDRLYYDKTHNNISSLKKYWSILSFKYPYNHISSLHISVAIVNDKQHLLTQYISNLWTYGCVKNSGATQIIELRIFERGHYYDRYIIQKNRPNTNKHRMTIKSALTWNCSRTIYSCEWRKNK